MANGIISRPFEEGVEKVLTFFKENKEEIAFSELRRKSFFSEKKDLNMVLYAMAENKFIQRIKDSPPIWQKNAESVLTDELRKDIYAEVIQRLKKRNPAQPKATVSASASTLISESETKLSYIQINAQCVQIGDNNKIIGLKTDEGNLVKDLPDFHFQ